MEPRTSLLDLPDDAIRKIFKMADISGMTRFVSPKLRTLFRDCPELKALSRDYTAVHAPSEIQNKGLGLVKWAHKEGMFACADQRGVSHVPFVTTPDLVEWYMREFDFDQARGYELLTTPEILEWAVAGGGERQFMFYLKQSLGPTEHDFLRAAKHGHLDVVRWGHRNGFNRPQWSSLCNNAADGGQLHVLEWARSVSPPYMWGADTAEYAAMGGHLHVLKWLKENGCPWTAHTINAAVRQGHDEVAKWARDNGCPTH